MIVEEDGYNKEEEEDGESSEEETTTANTQKIHSPGWSPSTEFCMFNLNSDKDWSKINLKYDFLSCLLTGTRVLLIDSNDWPTKKLIQWKNLLAKLSYLCSRCVLLWLMFLCHCLSYHKIACVQVTTTVLLLDSVNGKLIKIFVEKESVGCSQQCREKSHCFCYKFCLWRHVHASCDEPQSWLLQAFVGNSLSSHSCKGMLLGAEALFNQQRSCSAAPP